MISMKVYPSGKITITLCAVALLGSMLLVPGELSAQGILRPVRARQQQRREERLQKRIERQGGNKLAPAGETAVDSSTETPKGLNRSAKNSLEGISKVGMREFFSKDEREMAIPGFGRPAALLIILRQLDLSNEQVQSIKAIRQRVGNQLVALRQQNNQIENQLEGAIYGETYDPKRVDELSTQAGEKQAEIVKLQANIESQFRQILTPDQFFVYRFLVGEMLLPQRRPQLRPQQMQRRAGQMNQQNRPNQQDPLN